MHSLKLTGRLCILINTSRSVGLHNHASSKFRKQRFSRFAVLVLSPLSNRAAQMTKHIKITKLHQKEWKTALKTNRQKHR